jgi:uncharacterized membrane protein HdeD (DUF308 family)
MPGSDQMAPVLSVENLEGVRAMIAVSIGGSVLFFVLMPVIVALLALPLYTIIDAATKSSDAFRAADSNKTLWIVLPFFFGFLAAIVYLTAIRPKLKAASQYPPPG